MSNHLFYLPLHHCSQPPYLNSGDDEPAVAWKKRDCLAAWKKRGGGWGMEIGPGRQRLTPGRTAPAASEGAPERRGRRRGGFRGLRVRSLRGWGGNTESISSRRPENYTLFPISNPACKILGPNFLSGPAGLPKSRPIYFTGWRDRYVSLTKRTFSTAPARSIESHRRRLPPPCPRPAAPRSRPSLRPPPSSPRSHRASVRHVGATIPRRPPSPRYLAAWIYLASPLTLELSRRPPPACLPRCNLAVGRHATRVSWPHRAYASGNVAHVP
jgi:hypothetical protein